MAMARAIRRGFTGSVKIWFYYETGYGSPVQFDIGTDFGESIMVKRASLVHAPCPVAKSLDAIGD
jgi:hypothetical protein